MLIPLVAASQSTKKPRKLRPVDAFGLIKQQRPTMSEEIHCNSYLVNHLWLLSSDGTELIPAELWLAPGDGREQMRENLYGQQSLQTGHH